jgi:hypothetical protein
MNNDKKLYEICLKMIKDKHQLNEYSIDKFNTFYFQVFNNSSQDDNINDLNKLVLKKINEDIIFNSSINDNIQNKIIELQNIRSSMNANINGNGNINGNINANGNGNGNGNINSNGNGNSNGNEIFNDIDNMRISSSANIKYMKFDKLANNIGRSFIINTIKNTLFITNKYTNHKIYPSHLCIPSIIKNITPYIIIGIMDNQQSNITYTFIPEIIGPVWDIWKPVNSNYININIGSSQFKINLYDHTNNYLDLKNYYIDILEILEINNSYKIKVSNPDFFNINDKVKIIFNNNITMDNTIINKDKENNIYIYINNIKIEEFIQSKIYNLNHQLSIIFNIFPI